MAGETPAVEATPAADGAATDLLEVAAPAEAGKSAPEGAAPKETPAADAAKPESKPDAKAEGAEGEKPEGEKPDDDLLANNDEGKTPDKADGQPDAKKDETPETYEPFTLPDGIVLDEAAMAKATPIFKDLKLSQDQAQKLVSLQTELQQEAAAKQLAGFQQVKLDWRKSIKADAQFGGDKLPQTLADANALLVEYGDAELRTDLKEWGWANHPGLIKLLARVKAKLSPDKLVIADAAAQSAPKSAAEILWPDMYKNKE